MALKELYMKSGQGFILVFSLAQLGSVNELGPLREQIVRVKNAKVNFKNVSLDVYLSLSNDVFFLAFYSGTSGPCGQQVGLARREAGTPRDWDQHVTSVGQCALLRDIGT